MKLTQAQLEVLNVVSANEHVHPLIQEDSVWFYIEEHPQIYRAEFRRTRIHVDMVPRMPDGDDEVAFYWQYYRVFTAQDFRTWIMKLTPHARWTIFYRNNP